MLDSLLGFTLQQKDQLNAHSLSFSHVMTLFGWEDFSWYPAELGHCLILCCQSNPCVDMPHKNLTAILQSCDKSQRDTPGVSNNRFLKKITDILIYHCEWNW